MRPVTKGLFPVQKEPSLFFVLCMSAKKNNKKKLIVEEVDITPGKGVLVALSNQGYSVDESLAELIDNSIDSEAKIIVITIEKDFIEIKDDGIGMAKATLHNALRPGISTKVNSLGMYGVGLKSAAFFLGNEVHIKTKQKNSSEEYSARLTNEWISNGDNAWKTHIYTTSAIRKVEHFTVVTIKQLKTNLLTAALSLRVHTLSRFYAKMLATGGKLGKQKVEIFLNGKQLVPYELPKELLRKITVTTVYGKYFISSYSLETQDRNMANSGIFVYRNNRLIWEGKKYNYTYTPIHNNLHIVVEGDFFPVSASKRDIEVESLIWKEVEKTLLPFIKEEARRCKQEYKKEPEELKLENQKKLLDSFFKANKDILQLNNNKKKNKKNKQKATSEKKSDTQRKETNSNLPRRYGFPIAGKMYYFQVAPMKDKSAPTFILQEDKGVVTVSINQYGSIYEKTKDTFTYSAIILYHALADFIARKTHQKEYAQLMFDRAMKGELDSISL